jgi:hypothetical protein
MLGKSPRRNFDRFEALAEISKVKRELRERPFDEVEAQSAAHPSRRRFHPVTQRPVAARHKPIAPPLGAYFAGVSASLARPYAMNLRCSYKESQMFL